MGFSKLLIFCFVFLFSFTLLAATMPSEFIYAGWEATYGDADDEVASYYSMHNITMYQQGEEFVSTYPGSDQFDFPGMGSTNKMEFWWDDSLYEGKCFEVRHLTDEILGFWHGWHRLHFDQTYMSPAMPWRLFKYDLEQRWDDALNGSLFWAECDHARLNIIFQPNGTYTDIGDSWDGNELRILTSFEVDWNATSVSAWTVLGNLLTFQSPDLGIPGLTGTVFNTLIAGIFTVIVAILIIKVVQSMIPFIKGISE